MDQPLDIVRRICQHKQVSAEQVLARLVVVLESSHYRFSLAKHGLYRMATTVSIDGEAQISALDLLDVVVEDEHDHDRWILHAIRQTQDRERTREMKEELGCDEVLRLIFRDCMNQAEHGAIESSLMLDQIAEHRTDDEGDEEAV